jgi:BirA family transcriptional regulator, biotin operon repressor / biotin---[acetyl-CoA-carboxylase] ligase
MPEPEEPQVNLDCVGRQTFVAAVEHHHEIGSTNDRAKIRAAENDCPLPLLVLADRQTAGRGRGGNRWWAGEGSLTFSLVVGPDSLPSSLADATLVSLAAAMAVVDATRRHVPSQQAGLHWPNDVFAAGRKVSGILIETLANRRRVLGIGVNVNNRFDQAPDDVRCRAVSLCELAAGPIDATAVLVGVLQRVETRLAQLRSDPAALAADADRACLQRGALLCVETGAGPTRGICQGIAPDGALLLATERGVERLASGVLRHDVA